MGRHATTTNPTHAYGSAKKTLPPMYHKIKEAEPNRRKKKQQSHSREDTKEGVT